MAIKIENKAGESVGMQELSEVTPITQKNPGEPITPAATVPDTEGAKLENVDIGSINLDEVSDIGDGDSGEESTWGKQTGTPNPDEGKESEGGETPEGGTTRVKPGDPAEFAGGEGTPNEDKEFFGGVADLLKGKGFFSGDINIESEDDLATAFEAEIQSRLSDTTKQAMEYMGMGIPQQEVADIQRALAETSGITTEKLTADPKLAASIIYSEFKFKGFSDEDSRNYTEMIEKNGQLDVEAGKALTARKTNLQGMITDTVAKYKNIQKGEEEAATKRTNDMVASLDETKIFGRDISKTTVEKLKNSFNTVVGYTKSGEPVNALMKYKLENPVDFEHKLLYLFTVTEGFKNLTSLDRSAESRVSRKFKDSVMKLSSGKSFSDKQVTPKTKIDMDSIDDIV